MQCKKCILRAHQSPPRMKNCSARNRANVNNIILPPWLLPVCAYVLRPQKALVCQLIFCRKSRCALVIYSGTCGGVDKLFLRSSIRGRAGRRGNGAKSLTSLDSGGGAMIQGLCDRRDTSRTHSWAEVVSPVETLEKKCHWKPRSTNSSRSGFFIY